MGKKRTPLTDCSDKVQWSTGNECLVKGFLILGKTVLYGVCDMSRSDTSIYPMF